MLSFPGGYDEALEWLFAQTRGGQARDPARMRGLMQTLGLRQPPCSFHVVGTAGKGTVSSMIHGACAAAGLRSGLFLSPHVEDFRERISVGQERISGEAVLGFVRRVAPLELGAAFFELTLAMALEHFLNMHLEVATVEAGIGAKDDATAVLANVLCTVITNIGEDHLHLLGPGLLDVARDKAEAIRPGVPVVTGAEGDALGVIGEVASARHSPLYVASPDNPLFSAIAVEAEANPIRRSNQRLAAAALRVSGLNLSEEAVRQGLQTPPLPARAEVFCLKGRRVILDGAHNPSAARALAAMLAKPFVLVFGSLARKAGEETLAELEPYASRVIVTQVDKTPSALKRTATRHFVDDPVAAVGLALSLCPPEESVLIAGSLYLAGVVRPALRANLEVMQAVSSGVL